MSWIRGFAWDEDNLEHIAWHQVTAEEVEEALTGQYEVVVKYRREAWAPFRSECNHKNGQNDIGQCIFLTSIERR